MSPSQSEKFYGRLTPSKNVRRRSKQLHLLCTLLYLVKSKNFTARNRESRVDPHVLLKVHGHLPQQPPAFRIHVKLCLTLPTRILSIIPFIITQPPKMGRPPKPIPDGSSTTMPGYSQKYPRRRTQHDSQTALTRFLITGLQYISESRNINKAR